MAVISSAVDVATNVNAQSVVFSEQLLPGAGGGEQAIKPPADDSNESSSSSNGGGSGGSITLKEFYWDQILFYLVSAILGLSFLDISVEFFRGSTVQCFTPADLTRDQISYLNNYCYGSLPDSQYYLIFILISALLIIAPHYLWNSYFARHFDFFFDLVKKLDRLRDSNTGEYNPHNYDLVKKLEKKFSKFNTWIYRLYMLKLMAQLLISATVLLSNAFYFRETDFEETYTCPEILDYVNTTKWPIDSEVTCVYNSLNLLKFLRWAAFILLSLSIVFIIVGLVWGMIRHPNELGAKEIATFSTLSCLPPEEHDFPSLRNVLISILTCKVHKNLPSREDMSFEPIKLGEDESGRGSSNGSKQSEAGCCSRMFESLQHLFHPGISSDLDFLVMKLYFADSGHGQVFKDIQIYKEIQQQQSKDQELLYLLQRIQTDRIDEQIDKDMAKLEAGISLKDDTDDGFNEEDDLKNRLFRAGLESAGPGKNPEEAVYEEFQHLMGIDVEDWSYSMLRSVIYGFLDNAPNNSFAIDVSFGSSAGYSLVLARAFDHVATFHFNKYYRNLKETFHRGRYQAGYTTITYQEDIFSQEAAKITKCEKPIIEMFKETTDGRSIDLIVIGPINDRSKIATANLLIEKLYAKRKYFKRKSILMAIRPLKVGSKTRMDHFEQYTPPKSIYEDINDKIEKKLAENGVKMYTVTPLGDVRPYRYNQGELTQPSTSRVNTRRRGSSIRHSGDTTSTAGLRRRPSKTLMRLRSIIDAPPDIEQLPRGIAVQCGELECIFEFKIYQYSGRYCVDGRDATPPAANNNMPSHDASHDTSHDVSHDNNGGISNRHSNNDIEAINIHSSAQSLANQPTEAEVLSPTMPDGLPSPILPSTSQSPERIPNTGGSPISLSYDNNRSESLV